jgi:hypothetical protein
LTLALGDGQTTIELLVVGNAQLRLNVNVVGDGTVTSGAGINCGAACSALFDLGAPVTLQAATTNGSNSYFSGWSVDTCSGPAHGCSVEMATSQTVTATFSAMVNNLIFFSSEALPTNLGGVDPYDVACNQMATAAGINNAEGTGYLAMLSSSTSSVRDRFAFGVQGWIRADGRPFTGSLSELFDEQVIYYSATFDENGVADAVSPELRAMTGTDGDGSVRQTCNDWSTLDPDTRTTWGTRFGGPITWTFFGDQACDVPAHVICMGNTKSAPLQTTRTSGKQIWVTEPNYLVGAGLAPDAACLANRPAGVAGARALIATTNRPAGDVLQPDVNYVRPDGQLVGTGQQLLDREVLTGIWQTADGRYLGPEDRVLIVPTGAERLTEMGTPEFTCDDWTDPTGTKLFGAYAFANRNWWFRSSGRTCDEPVALYCVEP